MVVGPAPSPSMPTIGAGVASGACVARSSDTYRRVSSRDISASKGPARLGHDRALIPLERVDAREVMLGQGLRQGQIGESGCEVALGHLERDGLDAEVAAIHRRALVAVVERLGELEHARDGLADGLGVIVASVRFERGTGGRIDWCALGPVARDASTAAEVACIESAAIHREERGGRTGVAARALDPSFAASPAARPRPLPLTRPSLGRHPRPVHASRTSSGTVVVRKQKEGDLPPKHPTALGRANAAR